MQIFFTRFCTFGATIKAVGKPTLNPIKKALAHKNIKFGLIPTFIAVITPDIINAMHKAIKNGNNTLGVLKNFSIEETIIDKQKYIEVF